jgi:hypothetical protein
MVEEVDGVDAVRGPGSLTIKEGVHVDEVDLASPLNMDSVLVAASTRFGGTTFLLVKVDGDASLIAIHALAGPCKIVGIPNPEVVGFTESGLDSTRIPDLPQQDALAVVLGVTGVVELEEISLVEDRS